jgi:ankyrin repeat protein
LEEIDEQNWEYAHRLFQCVAAASRPLRVNELAEFLAFDFEAGSTPTLLADWRPEDPARTVLSTCTSLFAIVETHGGPPIVQFAHFSVKEYLMSARLAKADETISRFHVSMTPAHTVVAQSCLGVLLHLDENVTRDGLENFPLAEYAAEHWVGHARFGSVSSNMQDGMKRLFDPSRGHLSAWVSIYDTERPRRQSEQFCLSKARATSLHYAAFYGMHDVVEFLIVERFQDVNGLGFDKGAPLHVASRRRRADVAQLPLEHGAGAEIQYDDKCTPLLLTSQHGHAEVTRILLKYGADREARDYKTRTPLLLASQRGHLEVARLLLSYGADREARDYRNRTPLLLASQGGHVDITRVLLRHGADKEARGYTRHTSLHLASQGGHVEVARELLEHGADREARDNYEYTPLLLASERGHVGVARILLKYGADKEARNFHYERTPLLLASRHGHVEVARVLLEHGADRDALDDYGCTPLHLASRNGHVETTRVLREHGADTGALDDYGCVPLHLASRNEHVEITRILREHSADTGAQDEGGWRPLEITSIHRPVEFAGALLEHGADVKAKKDRDSLNEVQEEKILLKHGADENEESDVKGPTLLDQASEHGEHGSMGATRVLLEYDVNEDTQDVNETPLHLTTG